FLPREMDKQRVTGLALDNRADCGTLQPDQQIALPMPRNSTISGFRRAFADERFRRDVRPGLPPRPLPRDAQRPARAEIPDEFTFESATTFDIERLVDGLWADAHGLIIREIDRQPMRDLLRAPSPGPGSVLPMGFAPAGEPRWLGTGDDRAVGARDLPRQAIGDICVQSRVRDELRDLRSLRGHIRLPLRDCRPVLQLPAPCGCVASQLT